MKRQNLYIACSNCGKKKKTTKFQLLKRKHHFCNKNCYLEHWEKTAYYVNCAFCGKTIRKTYKHRHRTNYFCSRKCRYKWNRGVNTYNWVGGHFSYRGSDWGNAVKKVREKDNGQCAITGEKMDRYNLDVHHIIPFRIVKHNYLWNLITLKRTLHRRIELLSMGIVSAFQERGFSEEQAWKFVLIFWGNAIMKRKLDKEFLIKILYTKRQNNIKNIVSFLFGEYEKSREAFFTGQIEIIKNGEEGKWQT